MGKTSRTNELRRTLDADEVALGILDNTYSPELIEFYGELGLDFVWLDLEHAGPSPWDATRLEEFLRAADESDVELLVRIPTAEPALVRKVLDAGVRNVFVSRAETPEQVRRAVRASRFRYDGETGERGLANPRASRWGTTDDYVETEDEETLVGVTIETRAALDNLDAILDVPDLGFVFLGPLDFSVSFGHPGATDHEDVEEAVDTVLSASLDAGVPVGGLGFGMDDVNEKAEAGYQILNLGSTTGAVKQVVNGWLDDFRVSE